MKARYFSASSVLAVAISLGITQAAAAQAAAPKPAAAAEVSEVVVTGSYIAGTPEDAAQPVDVIGAADLQKEGSPTTVNL